MTMRRNGHIRQRSPGAWEIRYSLGHDAATAKRRIATATVRGDRRSAEKELRSRLKALDDNAHVDPDKITLKGWIDLWLAGLEVGARTAERYAQLLQGHVVPVLGSRRLQAIQPTDIDSLYRELRGKISDRTRHHVHVVLGTCLRTAVRKDKLVRNPIDRADPPKVEDKEIAQTLNSEQLKKLVTGFVGHPLHLFVATAVSTGARRNEMLALRWSDFDADAKTLRIARAMEQIKTDGHRTRRTKNPKTKTGTRTITIDDGLVTLLRSAREIHVRLVAGLPDGSAVDLSLIKLPPDTLIFPAPIQDESWRLALNRLRDADAVTRTFQRTAKKLGFGGLRLHDLRHTHGSRLIAAGLSIPIIAARLGHKPDVLLRVYAHEVKDAEERKTAADVIAALAIDGTATSA
jgi:integrase